MHLLIAVRGIKHNVDRYISDLQAQYLKYQHSSAMTPENPQGNCAIQLSVRPIQIFELVFPATSLKEVWATARCNNCAMANTLKDSFMAKQILGRGLKMLGYSECPDMPNINSPEMNAVKRVLWDQDVDVIALGVKEDRIIHPFNEPQKKFEGL